MINPTKNMSELMEQLVVVKDKVDKVKSTDSLEALLEIENDNAQRITVIENDIKAFKKYLGID